MSFRNAHKLFVRNLPWTVANKELKEYFSQFGRVRAAQVMFSKKTGFNLGYGFVTYADDQASQAALNHGEHLLEGNKLYLNLSYSMGYNRKS
jgi:RNA recognition motif-containing protein